MADYFWTDSFILVATSLFYNHFYSEQIKENYLNDYESFILNVGELSESDPTFIFNYLKEANVIHSKINFALRTEDQYLDDQGEWDLQFSENVYQKIMDNPDLRADLQASEEIHIRSDLAPDYESKTPYIFHIDHINFSGENYAVYAYVDLSFISRIERMVSIAIVVLILFNIFKLYLLFISSSKCLRTY